MTPAAAILALALAGLLAAPQARAQELGRLFLTPEQRAALDERRRAKMPDKPAVEAARTAPVTRIDGYVERSGGRSTVWVNGQPLAESAPQSQVRIPHGRFGEASVVIPDGEASRDARARVGQSIDTATGEIRDPLGDGEIRVRRPTDPPAPRK